MSKLDYILLALSAIAVTTYKLLKENMQKINFKRITTTTLLSLIVSLLVIPAVMKHFDWSIEVGLGLSAVINMFIEVILPVVQEKIKSKIDEL